MKNQHVLSIFQMMGNICPSIGAHISAAWDNTLSAYIHQVWQKPISCTSKIAMQSRKAFYAALRKTAKQQGIDCEQALAEFERYPVLQTGPHCQLYTNAVDFNAALTSWMGSKLHNLNYTVILNSVTRTMQWEKKQGPGWLNLKHDDICLFDLSPKKMSKLSVCASHLEPSFNINNLTSYLQKPSSTEKKGLEKLLKLIPTEKCDDFISAFTLTNQALLNQCDENQDVRALIIDDRFTAMVVSEHLRNPHSFVYKLIFSVNLQTHLERLLSSKLHEKQHLFLKPSTDYFWGLRDNKIRRLKITNNCLQEDIAEHNKPIKIPMESGAICEALNSGILLPNIFLSFLVLSLLPQIRVIGGTRQIGYFPLIQEIFSRLLDTDVFEENELLQELKENDLSAWGTNFIQDEVTPLEWLGYLPKGKEFSILSKHYCDMSIAEVTKELSIFKNHPIWKHAI